jgi:tetratricopeptide (TPR) repeat protein
MNLLEYSRNRCHVCHRKGIIPVVDLTIGNLFLEISKGEQTVSVVSVLKNIGFVLKNAIFSGKRAEEYFSKAIKYAEKIGAVGIQGQAYLGLGSLCRVQKKYHLAEIYLNRSIDIFGEINAIVFLEQANNELKKLPQKAN